MIPDFRKNDHTKGNDPEKLVNRNQKNLSVGSKLIEAQVL